ncbi:MAG: hypothetical protein HY296_08370, partial [Thaumarchaeota archaeon]|nr:hypothetical protein [Nitrososphaerota archaeon]
MSIEDTGPDVVPAHLVPVTKASAQARKELPIYKTLDSIDFSDHFVIIGDVGTGKSTVTPIHEFGLLKGNGEVIIR